MNKNYIRGVAKEREIKNFFERNGYISTRSAGSHNLFDVLCISTDLKKPSYGIQVKRSKLNIVNPEKHFKEMVILEGMQFHNTMVIELWLYIDFEGWQVFRLKEGKFKLQTKFKHIYEYKIPDIVL